MLSLQTFWYFASYERDSRSLKSLVVFIWIIITTQTCLIVYGGWVYIIKNFGDYMFLLDLVPTVDLEFLFAAIATVTVQAFFVFRICRLSGDKLWIPVAWAPLAISQIVLALYIVVGSIKSGDMSYVFVPLPKVFAIAYLAVSLFIDISIAMFLLALLRRHKERTRIRSTLKVIQRLMLLAVLNMVCSTTFSICDLVVFVSLPGTLYYVLFDMPVGALYCNTLLANLNMRAFIAEQQSVGNMDVMTFNSIGPQPVALTLKQDDHKVSSDSRLSLELAA